MKTTISFNASPVLLFLIILIYEIANLKYSTDLTSSDDEQSQTSPDLLKHNYSAVHQTTN